MIKTNLLLALRHPLNAGWFVLAGLLMMLLAWLTMSFQTIRASVFIRWRS